MSKSRTEGVHIVTTPRNDDSVDLFLHQKDTHNTTQVALPPEVTVVSVWFGESLYRFILESISSTKLHHRSHKWSLRQVDRREIKPTLRSPSSPVSGKVRFNSFFCTIYQFQLP
jgi:hypothetical protein